jgi:transcription elongation factor GreA
MREENMNISNITHFNIDDSDKYASTMRGINMTNGNFMTASTRDKILAQIRELEGKKPTITEQIGNARLQGGLEENEELIMALEEMQRVDMDIHRHQEKLVDIQLIQPLSPGIRNIITVGTTVTILNIDTDVESIYTILGEHDSDPNNGIISFKSPLGAELLQREVDDEVEIRAGNNITNYEIIKIVVKKLQ